MRTERQPGRKKGSRPSSAGGFRVDGYVAVLLLILAFGAFLSYFFFYGPSPMNGADNYLYSDFSYAIYKGQFHQVSSLGVLAQQYILLFGIAFFYLVFGTNALGASAFGVLCFLLTLVVLYKMGSVLYNRKAGLLSAFIYSFNPIAVINASYVGDNGPMALMVSLSVLFLVLGIKENAAKQSQQRHLFYALSGFFGLASMLTSSQAIVIFAFAAPFVIFYLAKRRNRDEIINTACFIIGIALAFAAMALLETWLGNPPLYIFTLNYHIYTGDTPQIYSSVQSPRVQFNSYVSWIFPFSVLSNLGTAVNALTSGQQLPKVFSSISGWISSMFDRSRIQYTAVPSSSFFGYLAVLAAVYLLLRRNTRFLIPGFWFLSTFLYMGLGTVSVSHYVPIGIAYPRLMLISLPALGLVVGFAIADLLESGESRWKYIAVCVAAFLVGATLYHSLENIQFIALSEYKSVYPLIQLGGFMQTLPSNASVYTNPVFPLNIYTSYHFNHTIPATLNPDPENCSSSMHRLPANSYIAVQQPRSDVLSVCNFTEVFGPPYAVPAWLANYSLLDKNSFGTYWNVTLYYNRG